MVVVSWRVVQHRAASTNQHPLGIAHVVDREPPQATVQTKPQKFKNTVDFPQAPRPGEHDRVLPRRQHQQRVPERRDRRLKDAGPEVVVGDAIESPANATVISARAVSSATLPRNRMCTRVR